MSTPMRKVNVGPRERAFSLGAGLGAVVLGLRLRPLFRSLAFLAGGGLLGRGITGSSFFKGLLGFPRGQARDYRHGIKVSEMVTINRPPDELYRIWRNFENLPKIMKHLSSVTVIDPKRSRWKAKGPAGTTIEWEAEIVRDLPNELITWQSLENSRVVHAGSVSFEKMPGSEGTEVKVILRYEPPGGALGAAIAGLLGEEPSSQIKEDLRDFKRQVEFGELSGLIAK